MKVEVIKCLSHSIELILGETSVCITTDEAQNLIAQLRAVVPVPSDVEEAAEKWATTTHFEWPNQVPAGKKGFIAGMLGERERLMKEAVEGQVSAIDTARFIDIDQDICDKRLAERKDGDKVKLIIVKEAGK